MLYFEDLAVGDKFNTPEHTITTEEIVAFGRQFDPQAFHTDATDAKASLFGQLVASGWHTAADLTSLF
jgi:acyl dehydratase